MNKLARTLLIDGYQPKPPKSGTRLVRDSETGVFASKGPGKLPKAVSAIKTPNKKK